jgi:A/G-specific adenine glycosylase
MMVRLESIQTTKKTDQIAAFRNKLFRWFKTQRRDLPWRHDATPYTVWISEVMLQQTVFKTVIPYYSRWLNRFPDVATLANANEREVLTLWEGLGYYNRARNIHRAACEIMRHHEGELPQNLEVLKKLPGIGEYTAAAIMSIAFGAPYPVVDANARRVVSRVLAIRSCKGLAEKQIREFLTEAVSHRKPGLFNEAVMELGQTVCQNRRPTCESCPLKTICLAFQKGLQDEIPQRTAEKTVRKRSNLLLVISGNMILAKRKDKGLFAGLWILPISPVSRSVKEAGRELLGKSVEFETPSGKKLKPHIHHYTRFAERLNPVILSIKSMRQSPEAGWRWLKIVDLYRYPFPSVYRRILDESRPLLGRAFNE